MCRETAERRALRQQHGKVIQAERPCPRSRPDPRLRMEPNQLAPASFSAKHRRVQRAIENAQAQDVLVVVKRARQIRNLQPHPADVRRIGQAETAGRGTVRTIGSHCQSLAAAMQREDRAARLADHAMCRRAEHEPVHGAFPLHPHDDQVDTFVRHSFQDFIGTHAPSRLVLQGGTRHARRRAAPL